MNENTTAAEATTYDEAATYVWVWTALGYVVRPATTEGDAK